VSDADGIMLLVPPANEACPAASPAAAVAAVEVCGYGMRGLEGNGSPGGDGGGRSGVGGKLSGEASCASAGDSAVVGSGGAAVGGGEEGGGGGEGSDERLGRAVAKGGLASLHGDGAGLGGPLGRR